MTSVPTYGAFAVDPGGSTGLAWARLRDEGTIQARLEERTFDGYETIKGHWMAQARIIVNEWLSFQLECKLAGLPAYMVMEDFILTKMKSSDREGLYPVWVGAAIMGYRNGMADAYESNGLGPAAPVRVVWQQPGQAATYATDDRLRRWGLWIPGAAHVHERSARRHLALFVADEKSSRMRNAHMKP